MTHSLAYPEIMRLLRSIFAAPEYEKRGAAVYLFFFIGEVVWERKVRSVMVFLGQWIVSLCVYVGLLPGADSE